MFDYLGFAKGILDEVIENLSGDCAIKGDAVISLANTACLIDIAESLHAIREIEEFLHVPWIFRMEEDDDAEDTG